MRVFAYDPAGPERLKAFNERLVEYCDEEAVIDISAQIFNNQVVVSCLGADDMFAPPGQPVLVAMLRNLTPETDLEDYLNKVVEDFTPEDGAEEGPVPVKIQLLEKTNKPGTGFALFVCINGLLDAEPDDGTDEDDEDDDGEDDPEGGDVQTVEAERIPTSPEG